MATNKATVTNIDNSDPTNFPNGRIKDNTGSGNGTPVNRLVYSDLHEYFAKLMRLAGIAYSGVPDSESTGYQLVDAAIALAGKNDFITPLNTIVVVVGGVNTNVVSVDLKLSLLKINEAFVAQVTFNLTDQTQIKGSEAALQNITVPKPFKNGDYVRFIKTNTGVTLIRLADALNIDVLVSELLYLKAATEAQEYAGISQVVATTPYTAQLAFFRRVCGLDSSIFLASASRNGLLSAAQWSILNAIPANPVKNVGWFSGVDAGGGTVGSTAPVHGDITRAEITYVEPFGHYTTYVVTMANAMANTSYYVRFFIQSEGTPSQDLNVLPPVFRPTSITQFEFDIQQFFGPSIGGGVQNLKIHCEVVQIS